jgi:hypothetical protein
VKYAHLNSALQTIQRTICHKFFTAAIRAAAAKTCKINVFLNKTDNNHQKDKKSGKYVLRILQNINKKLFLS